MNNITLRPELEALTIQDLRRLYARAVGIPLQETACTTEFIKHQDAMVAQLVKERLVGHRHIDDGGFMFGHCTICGIQLD